MLRSLTLTLVLFAALDSSAQETQDKPKDDDSKNVKMSMYFNGDGNFTDYAVKDDSGKPTAGATSCAMRFDLHNDNSYFLDVGVDEKPIGSYEKTDVSNRGDSKVIYQKKTGDNLSETFQLLMSSGLPSGFDYKIYRTEAGKEPTLLKTETCSFTEGQCENADESNEECPTSLDL